VVFRKEIRNPERGAIHAQEGRESAMKVHLEYGKQGLEVDLPDGNMVGVLSMGGAAEIADPAGEIQRALDHPMGTPALAGLARGASSACVVLCDITRPVPNALLLPPMLAALEGAGVPRGAITLLVATGLHRPSSTDELRMMLGQEILQTYRVVNHRAREMEEQRFVEPRSISTGPTATRISRSPPDSSSLI
jgi:nickel-dependent lactate racemase